MKKFVIGPHMRLQEWVAQEKGYFDDEGLDYELKDQLGIFEQENLHDLGDKVGAYQTFEEGRTSDVSCACHWTVNVAAASGHGKLYADAYSVSPCGIFVGPNSPINKPEDLANVPISVGYQSGSHYSTVQGLEQFLKPDEINLSFADGLIFRRLELLIDGGVPAASLFSGAYYYLQQLGFRKILDTSFMMASMVDENSQMNDVKKYFAALRRAQADIDLRPELYTHYYKAEFPDRFKDEMDTRLFGPGERLVFEPYTRETFEMAQQWIAEHNIFDGGDLGSLQYKDAVVSLA